MSEDNGACSHVRAYVTGMEVIGLTTCPDCGEHPHVVDVLNELLRRLREAAGVKEHETNA